LPRGDGTLGNEYVSLCRVFTLQLAQGADLVAPDRMDAWRSALGSADMQSALVELDLMPFEAADFTCSHPMAIGDQDHGCVAVSVAAELAGRVHELLNLALGEIAASNCEVFSVWCVGIGSLFCHEKSPSG
jgi:hypothetical protein